MRKDARNRRISRLELGVAGAVALVLLALVVAEPDILEAPFENGRTILFTVGGTVVAAIALGLMLVAGVPPLARVLVLGTPFLAVNWWLLSPYFIDDVVEDDFVTSIAESESGQPPPTTSSATPGTPATPGTSTPDAGDPLPVLRGSGMFVGLAGHDGTGDAGLFRLTGGEHVLRLENFDIDNGPDLELYLVPGADQRSLADGAVHLGALRGNKGNQTYEIGSDVRLDPGAWTVLVWCEAFAVEFVGATLDIA
jgi:hypothetical protein